MGSDNNGKWKWKDIINIIMLLVLMVITLLVPICIFLYKAVLSCNDLENNIDLFVVSAIILITILLMFVAFIFSLYKEYKLKKDENINKKKDVDSESNEEFLTIHIQNAKIDGEDITEKSVIGVKGISNISGDVDVDFDGVICLANNIQVKVNNPRTISGQSTIRINGTTAFIACVEFRIGNCDIKAKSAKIILKL